LATAIQPGRPQHFAFAMRYADIGPNYLPFEDEGGDAMFRRLSLGLTSAFSVAILFLVAPFVLGQEAVRSAPKVELRWVESQRVDMLTEAEGFQSSCDPDSIVYPHRRPALVLTKKEVAEARLSEHDFTASGLSKNYMVALHLTEEARKKLAESCEGDQMRLLTIVVDGKCWGLHRYEKNKAAPFVPEGARAESFLPEVGFFSSKAEAQRLVRAFE
jgi:hypothetical protein